MFGALLGLGTQMYSNALRKLPYMRRMLLLRISLFQQTLVLFFLISINWLIVVVDPWEHVLGMGLGAVFVNQLLKWEAQVEKDLDKMLEKAKAANERRYFGNFIVIIMIFIWVLWNYWFLSAHVRNFIVWS